MMTTTTTTKTSAAAAEVATARKARRAVMRSVVNVTSVGRCDTWATPPEVFDRACKMCGVRPVLDVCATAETAKCAAWYGPGGERGSGLAAEWDRPWWCNPPYSEVAKWVARAHDQTVMHDLGVPGIMLVFAKTDTAWWHRYVEGRTAVVRPYFWRGRIRFLGAGGVRGKNSAPYPSVVLRFGAFDCETGSRGNECAAPAPFGSARFGGELEAEKKEAPAA